MDWNARIRTELPATTSQEVIEELAQHARAMYDAARAEGCDLEEADRRVARQVDAWRASAAMLHHRAGRLPTVAPPPVYASFLTSLSQDVKYAARLLRRQPRFALLVILTMAIGIGTTTSLFSVTYGVLMKPLPWPDAERIVALKETRGGNAPRFGSISNAAYLAWTEQAATIEAIAAWSTRTQTVTGEGEPERIRVTNGTASLFKVLGVRPIIGSVFTDKEDTAHVALLSETFWRRSFAADPHILGRVLHLDGEPFTILGVVPDHQGFPDPTTRAWVPFRVPQATNNLLSMFESVAKLAPGATVAQAAAEGTARGRFAPDTGMTTMAIFGGTGAVEISARPLRDALTGETRRPLLVLLAAVLLLLAIATTNVAGLQFARGASRQREFAIRAAVGASSARVARQLVVENVILGGIGGATGLALALWLHRSAASILPADFPRVQELAIDLPVVWFAVALTIAASLVCGLLPARRVGRMSLVSGLAEDGVSPVGASWRSATARTRLVIIGAQVAAACVLLVGAALLGRSFMAMLHADRGYDAAEVLTAAVPMGPAYSPQRRTEILEHVITEVAAAPGVQAAAFTSEAPLTPGGSTSSMTLRSRDASAATVRIQASPRLVSPAYFSALGLRITSGRSLADSDTATSRAVVVVNESFAKRCLQSSPGSEVLGGLVPMGIWGAQQGDALIIGIVEDIRYIGGPITSLPEMYFSYRQLPFGMRSPVGTLLVRTAGDASLVASTVRSALRDVDAALLSTPMMTLEDRLLATSLARPRLYAVLLAAFAVVALVVTGVGLFGVLSFTVAQRTRELGVRAALGATRSDLVFLVLRQGLMVTLAGILVGLIAAAWAGRSLSTLLYGITTFDPVTYVSVPIILVVVAVVACFAPALRAARLDPLRALRSS
jgi:putative ABC transport system permease protein